MKTIPHIPHHEWSDVVCIAIHDNQEALIAVPTSRNLKQRPMYFEQNVPHAINVCAARISVVEKLQLAASVFSHAREAILITRADGVIIDVNDAFTRITGYTREEVIGKNPRILNSGRQGREFFAGLWDALGAQSFASGAAVQNLQLMLGI